MVGRSLDLGDSLVVSTGRDGVRIECADGSCLLTSDPQLSNIVPYEEYGETTAMEDLKLVYLASDEYEAAISVYHCVCTRDGCVCKRTVHAHAAFAFASGAQSIERARPIAWVYGTRRPFDEYRCAEKLDRRRLNQVVADLRTDEAQRNGCLAHLEARLLRTSTPQLVDQVKKLKRCQVLGQVANALSELTAELVADPDGYVIHEVEYEHKDPSFRGRLFAKGKAVNLTDDKYPRTATLQSMHKDLRNKLVGAFAHDVDCENSEYRLICSLATQMHLEELVPTVISYRDQRKTWLDTIC